MRRYSMDGCRRFGQQQHRHPAMKYIPLLISIPLALLSATPLLASDLEPEAELFQELPIVLSATRLQQSAHDAPSSITVITHKMIQAIGPKDIADIFNYIPGFQVGYASATNPVVTYHGLSDQYQRRMQILVDGRSVYQPNWGGAAWANLPLIIDDIERIEIIRGPNAASYGSNAFKATINIITRHSLNSQGGYFRAMKGNKNAAESVLRYGDQSNDLSYRISASHEQFNGYLDPALGGHHDQSRWDYRDLRKLNFRSDYQYDLKNVLHLNAGYSSGDFGERKSRSYYSMNKQRSFAHLSWEHFFSEINQTTLRLYLNKEHNIDYFTSEKLALRYGSVENPLPIDRSERAERIEVEFQHSYSPNNGTRFAWGLNSRINKANSYYQYHTDQDIVRHQSSAFINIEKHLDKWTLSNIGLMAERTSAMETKYSPRLSINRRLSPNQTLRLSASRAYRVPVTYEQFADSRITDSGTLNDIETLSLYSLEPEKITAYDIGYVFQSKHSPYSADLRIFREELRGLITPYPWVSSMLGVTDDFVDPSLGYPILLTFQNQDSVNIEGFESQLNYSPNRHSQLRLAYSYLDIASTQHSRDALWENFAFVYNDYRYDMSAPQHTISLLGYYLPQDNVNFTIGYHWVDEMKWNGGIGDNLQKFTREGIVPSHDRIDIRIAIPFTLTRSKGEIALNVRNLLDDNHYDFQKHHKSTRISYVNFKLSY